MMTRILVLVAIVIAQYFLWRRMYKPDVPQDVRPPTTLQFFNLFNEITALWNKLF